MRLAVLIPVYQEPKFLLDLIGALESNTYQERDFYVVVDGDVTCTIAAALDSLGSRVSVIRSGRHLGKAAALNHAVQTLSADALLFLDNDVALPPGEDFLSLLAEGLQTHDLVEMPKDVLVESWFSAMIGYEYQGLAMASLILSRIAGRSPGLIGAAFAVKKPLFDHLGGFRLVVHEDGDFAARSFRVHAKYLFDFRLKVKTSMPNTLQDWVKQRKRWTTINVLWFKDNFAHLLKSAFKQPRLIPALGLIALPSILSLAAFVLLQYLNLTVVSPFVFMVGQPVQAIAGVLLWFVYNTLFSQGLVSTALSFLISAGIYFGFSATYRYHFNLLSFAVFSFFYLPLLVLMNIAMFILLLRKKRLDLEWKT